MSEPTRARRVRRGRPRRGDPLSLLWRVFLLDAAVLAVAVVVVAASPITVSAPPEVGELAVLFGALAAMLLVTLLLLRRTLRPLDALTATMRRIDPLAPGKRVSVERSDANVRALASAFNDMLDRLEDERRDSARRALLVQEGERRRVARELHDEVGQTLTAVLLQIESLSAQVPEGLTPEIDELRETTRTGAEEVRRIARRLRPEALDELGLPSAVAALARNASDQATVRVRSQVAAELPPLTDEQELVIYRVAQEALTNVVRHAEASEAEATLRPDDGAVVLTVSDDGRGLTAGERRSTHGIRGMRERAMLVGAQLSIESAPGRGTRVSLRVPAGRDGA